MEERHLNRARRFLQRWDITPQDLAGFSFMKRYTPVTERHSDENKYGPGLLTLHRKDGEDLVLTLHARHHPSSVVRYLIKEGVPFDNLHAPAGQTAARRSTCFGTPYSASWLSAWASIRRASGEARTG